MNKDKVFATIVVILLIAAGVATYFLYANKPKSPEVVEQEPVACTQEAKLCPDGSYVGRSGPSCEFAACPPVSEPSWQTFTDATTTSSFQYPATLPTKYISATDWPPAVQILNQPFTCTQAGTSTSRAGQTVRKTVNGHDYCITQVSEGAAGSIYNQYAYAFAQNNKTVILNFTLRMVQCLNYDDSQKTECEAERATFNIDDIMDRVAQTFKQNQK
ncbi:MAG: hypothetical protein HY918_05855 [Candidatus Doudnabacteria bacterium]|nr:hypothetical protein [Candidatus Doudnabacteria bacterium]